MRCDAHIVAIVMKFYRSFYDLHEIIRYQRAYARPVPRTLRSRDPFDPVCIRKLKTCATFADTRSRRAFSSLVCRDSPQQIAREFVLRDPSCNFFFRAGIQSAFPINGTEITTVAPCPAKDQRSSYSTGNKVERSCLSRFSLYAAM